MNKLNITGIYYKDAKGNLIKQEQKTLPQMKNLPVWHLVAYAGIAITLGILEFGAPAAVVAGLGTLIEPATEAFTLLKTGI